MNARRVALIFVAGVITASCSDKAAPDHDNNATASEASHESARLEQPQTEENEGELQPPEDKIGEDCVAFVRSTKVVPAQSPSADCPGCPAQGTDVLAFREMRTDAVFCSGDTCNVTVTIRAVFNAGSGERIAGGLTAWISPEERNEYLSGGPPSGEQEYHVKITYKRRGEGWRAVEFDRAEAQ